MSNKTKVLCFDEWYTEAKKLNDDGFSAKDFFEAGQQSKQPEVDELQKKYNAMYNAFVVADDCRKEWHRCYVGIRQREDELQKRIDLALNKSEDFYDFGDGESAMAFCNEIINILKGEETK